MEFPEPVIRVAIEPKTKAGQEKMGHCTSEARRRGSDLQAHTPIEETGQTIIAGMGELHLEIIVDRLLREFKVEANVGKPQVAYKETIRKSVERTRIRHASPAVRASTAMSRLPSSRTNPARAMSLSTQIVGRRDPEGIYPLGRRRVLKAPCTRAFLRATRSSTSRLRCMTAHTMRLTPPNWPLRLPASMAFKDAMRKADPVLLEPIMKVVVTCPR